MKISLLFTTLLLVFSITTHAGVEAIMNVQDQQKNKPARTHKMKIFVQGKNFRMDSDLSQMPNMQLGKRAKKKMKGKVSHIQNGDENKRYSVMHSEKKVMILPPNKRKTGMNFLMTGESINIAAAKRQGYQIKKIGTKKVEGHNCTQYEITGTNKHQMKKAKGCFANDLEGLMLQMEGTDKSGSKTKIWMTDIQKKPLAKNVFLPPAGYQTMTRPNVSAFGQKNMTNQMQDIQSLPPEQREAAMKKWQENLKKQAEQLKKQYSR